MSMVSARGSADLDATEPGGAELVDGHRAVGVDEGDVAAAVVDVEGEAARGIDPLGLEARHLRGLASLGLAELVGKRLGRGDAVEPVLDSVQQRIERLILEPRPPPVPEQAALPPDVEQARRIARPVLAGDPRRMRQPVGACTLRLVAGRARHLTVRAERTVEEQQAAERGDRHDPSRLPSSPVSVLQPTATSTVTTEMKIRSG